MPPFFPNDFVSPSKAIALVGATLYGDEWNGCHTRREAGSFHNAIAANRKARTIDRQRELWPALRANSQIVRRRARILELSDEGAAKHFVSLGDALRIRGYATAWFRAHLMDDADALAEFYGVDCGICTDPEWTVARNYE
ncbi:MAG: hypothetical protein IID31_14000 [Planctomycetes bacterium]|nr:hypothetical protein [Planctomycetota bacterium]